VNNRSCPENANELQVCTEMRAFARLVLPIYELEYQRQLTNPAPCWLFLSILERRLRELEKQAQ
jgi:hypothetical protein